ncbi:MAG: N-acetylmuramoyl-L-alanine amidase [Bacteroidota bacterium]
MKRLLACVLFLIIVDGFSNLLYAQSADRLFVQVVIPEEDTLVYSGKRIRINGSTLPEAEVSVNGEDVFVYPNGAFATRVELEEGDARIHVLAMMGDSTAEQIFTILRPTDPEPIPAQSQIITNREQIPKNDIWLKKGDPLRVQFQGSSGEDVFFQFKGDRTRYPMTELPPEHADGKVGVYAANWIVDESEFMDWAPLIVSMDKGWLRYEEREMDVKVRLNGLPRVGEVISDRAYLNIGMGQDRLGGARYGSLHAGVRLNIVGQKNNTYNVKLSGDRSAWIPANQVQLLPQGVSPVHAQVENIIAFGRKTIDVVSLQLNERIPYTSRQVIDPNQIVIDLWGATSNINWNALRKSARGIKKVEWEQVADQHIRLRIHLNQKVHWGYDVAYTKSNKLEIRVNRPPVLSSKKRPLKGVRIALDVGHGGENKGALGSTGLTEKEINLQLAKSLRLELEKRGANVLLTRTRDTTLTMREREQLITGFNSQLMLSIHANSAGLASNPITTKGTGVFFKHEAFKPLAEVLYSHMLELDLPPYGITGSFNFTLNGMTEVPNVLLETAFMSNPEEEILLSDAAFQAKVSRRIVKALEQYIREKNGYN